jgi:hemoglobin-like flavoprotein
VETLYRRLFAATPAVLPLFAGTDLSRQKAKLPATLVLLRKSLRSLDALVPELPSWVRGTARTARRPTITRWSART